MNPQVSIVILNRNGPEGTTGCLEYLGKVTYPHC